MIVFDTVYNPEQTLLIKEAREQGCVVITGVDMFVRQAALQFARFTDQKRHGSDAAGQKSHRSRQILAPRWKMFDPYQAWLGIHPAEHPIDYYRLFGGLPRFETNADSVRRAYASRRQVVCRHQAGPQLMYCPAVLRELDAAQIWLTDPHKKSHYDTWLLQGCTTTARPPALPPPPGSVAPPAAPPAPEEAPEEADAERPSIPLLLWIPAAIALLVIVSCLTVFVLMRQTSVRQEADSRRVADSRP